MKSERKYYPKKLLHIKVTPRKHGQSRKKRSENQNLFTQLYPAQLSLIFGHVKIRLAKKAKVDFKIFEIIDFTTGSYNTPIPQYLKK